MKKTALTLAAAFATLVSLPAEAKHYDMLAFGDSISQGMIRGYYGSYIAGITSPQWGTRYTQADGYHGYEPVLESLVSTGSNNLDDAYVYNWGYMGETTFGGVNRISTALASRSADIILLLEGANDPYSGISASTTAFNLGVMVDKARAADVTPVTSNLSPNTNTEGPIYWAPYIWAAYNPAIADMATAKEVVMADMYNPLAGANGELWASYTSGDGLHLNSTGYKKMASIWYDTLLVYIKRINLAPVIQLLLLDD